MKSKVLVLLSVLLTACATASATDLSLTAANILVVSGQTYTGTANVAITAGQIGYKGSNGQLYLAKSDTAAHASVAVMFVNSAGAGQPVSYVTSGSVVTIQPAATGSPPAIGTCYFVSANSGNLAPGGDLTSGNYVSLAVIVTQSATASLTTQVTLIPTATGNHL